MDGGLLSFIPGISLVNRGCENAHHVFRKMFVGCFLTLLSRSLPNTMFRVSRERILIRGTILNGHRQSGLTPYGISELNLANFADRRLFYVATLWVMPKPDDEDFEKFFMQRFLAGLSVIDNIRENELRILEILKKRGLSLAG
jgi:hypothetical protein